MERPSHSAALLVFRVGFALLLFINDLYLLGSGLARTQWVDQSLYFPYYGFGWLPVLPGNALFLPFWVHAVAALLLALGKWPRFSAATMFLCFGYLFVIDQSNYLNHYYLVLLVTGTIAVLAGHPAWRTPLTKLLDGASVPRWHYLLLGFLIALPYFFGGLSKIHGEWLLNLQPARLWMSEYTGPPTLKNFVDSELWIRTVAWGGMIFDLLIVPALLWRRTRWFAFAAACGFHLLNWHLFNIGIFPWMMILATTLFLPHHWPRALVRKKTTPLKDRIPEKQEMLSMTGSALLGLFVAYHLIMPFRHHLYPSWALWTDEGARFSWMMKMKNIDHHLEYWVIDKEAKKQWIVKPEDHLTPYQIKRVWRTDMIQAFAISYADDYEERTGRRPIVRAKAIRRLNAYPAKLLVHPEADLAATRLGLKPKDWLLPFEDNPYYRPEDAP